MNMSEMIDYAPSVVNNYYIRSLLGQRTFRSPRGSITEWHLRQALHVLEAFDMILVLESIDADVSRLHLRCAVAYECWFSSTVAVL